MQPGLVAFLERSRIKWEESVAAICELGSKKDNDGRTRTQPYLLIPSPTKGWAAIEEVEKVFSEYRTCAGRKLATLNYFAEHVCVRRVTPSQSTADGSELLEPELEW
jgi:hypothetical protein